VYFILKFYVDILIFIIGNSALYFYTAKKIRGKSPIIFQKNVLPAYMRRYDKQVNSIPVQLMTGKLAFVL